MTNDDRLQIAVSLLDKKGLKEYSKMCEDAEFSTFIFLTTDGTTQDGAGEDVNNNQHIGFGVGHTVLDAYNDMLRGGRYAGDYDTCFAYKLVDCTVRGRFDLIQDTQKL